MHTVRRFFMALAALLLFPLAVFAQAVPDAGGGSAAVPMCVLLGPIITTVLQPFKHIPFIKNNTFLLSMIASVVLNLSPQHGAAQGLSIGAIVACILTTLGGATATHRALIKPVEKSSAGTDPQHRAVDLMERYLSGLMAPTGFVEPPSAPTPKRR